MKMLFDFSDSKKVISQYAKKEFKDQKIKDCTYTELQESLINIFRKHKDEINEQILATEQDLIYLEIQDFDKFIGLRLGIYACVIAIFTIIITNQDLISIFNISHPELYIRYFILFFIFLFISLRVMSNYQKKRTIYLRFKLNCLRIVKNK